ncbi:MAG: hypothetical protein QXH51_06735 [Candidatus Bathyarchaeia archaeon]
MIYIVDWDIPEEKRFLFYYYLKKIKRKYRLSVTISTYSVVKVNDEKLAREIFELASKYGKANLYKAELIAQANQHLR